MQYSTSTKIDKDWPAGSASDPRSGMLLASAQHSEAGVGMVAVVDSPAYERWEWESIKELKAEGILYISSQGNAILGLDVGA